MKRKLGWGALALLLVAALGLFGIAPAWVDRDLNRIDGAPLSTDRSSGLIASNGAASLAATHPRAKAFVAALWAIEPPSGRFRYYNGLLEFMAMLHASGRFRAY